MQKLVHCQTPKGLWRGEALGLPLSHLWSYEVSPSESSTLQDLRLRLQSFRSVSFGPRCNTLSCFSFLPQDVADYSQPSHLPCPQTTLNLLSSKELYKSVKARLDLPSINHFLVYFHSSFYSQPSP